MGLGAFESNSFALKTWQEELQKNLSKSALLHCRDLNWQLSFSTVNEYFDIILCIMYINDYFMHLQIQYYI